MSLAAESQEIYRWVDKDGVVHYADQPGAPDAERVEIANSNSYEATPPEPGAAGSYSQPLAPQLYESLIITQPAEDEVFFGADATVTGTAKLGGTLQSGHVLAFYLDGNRVAGESGDSVQLSNLDRGTHFLSAAVVDENGNTLLSSGQVAFHIREPSIKSPQSPQARKPPPKPAPTPAGPKSGA